MDRIAPHTLQSESLETALAAIAILLALALLFRIRRPRRQFWRGKVARPSQAEGRPSPLRVVESAPAPRDLRDPAAQMHAIAAVGFERQRILNREEARLLYVLEAGLREYGSGHRLFAQTSLGELLRPSPEGASAEACREAYAAINSKRLDFAVIDRSGFLAAAIEYHGGGHHQRGAFMRDAVKREALRKAGVPFIEIEEGYDATEVRQRLGRVIGATLAASSQSSA